MHHLNRWLYIIIALFGASGVYSQIQLPPFFTDNMVLQREKPINIWGKGVPGMEVVVEFGGHPLSTLVKVDSSWSVSFPGQKVSEELGTLKISSGNESLELHNIVLGDIWLCLGQSNMEWPMSNEMHWPEERKEVDQSKVRILNAVPAGRNIYGEPYSDSLVSRLTVDRFYQWSPWTTSDIQSVASFSAVGYYFGKTLVQHTGIPMGMINLSIGGAPAESFIRREALDRNESFAPKVRGDWLSNEALPDWVRERGYQNVGSSPDVPRDALGKNHGYKPDMAYESGIKPLLPFPIAGILWYQGESNAQERERVMEYGDLIKVMVEDYRTSWNQPEMPFYWVQLSSIDTIEYNSQLWPEFRDEQRKMLDAIPYGGMAVTCDIGNKTDVHPRNKKDVGFRLARWALHNMYHKKNIIPSGPLPLEARYSEGKVTIHFRYASDSLRTSDGQAVRGFSLDGKSPIPAVIVQNTVEIPVRRKPDSIYYGWAPYTDANLVNAADLPTSTFRMKVE